MNYRPINQVVTFHMYLFGHVHFEIYKVRDACFKDFLQISAERNIQLELSLADYSRRISFHNKSKLVSRAYSKSGERTQKLISHTDPVTTTMKSMKFQALRK